MFTQVSNRTNNGALIFWGESRRGNIPTHVKVYMTDFVFICSIKSPQCTDKNIKKKLSIAIFLPRVLTYRKTWNFTSCGVQNRETGNDCDVISGLKVSQSKQISPTFCYFLINNARLYPFLANWLAHHKKMTEKSEASSPEMMSSSLLFCTPPQVKFYVFGTSKHGEGKSISNDLFCYTYQYIREVLSSKLIKICHMHNAHSWVSEKGQDFSHFPLLTFETLSRRLCSDSCFSILDTAPDH